MSRLLKNAFEKLKSYHYASLNVFLILLVSGLTILGINVIRSAQPDDPSYYKKQIFGFILGLVFMIVLALLDYKFILKFYFLIYLINLLLLFAVKLFGSNHMGAQRWIEFGSSLQIQPSEFAKVLLVLFFAKFLDNHKEKITSFKVIASSVVFLGIPLLLILEQPDLSTSITIGLMFCVLMFVAGISYKFILGLIIFMVPVVTIFVYLIMQPDQQILDEYQLERIVGFYDKDNPDTEDVRWQQDNAEMAIGSGGLWGKGLNNDSEDSVKNGNYIPEPQTDFIFAIVGEELGFVGTTTVITLLLLIALQCFIVAARAPDLSGRILCAGIGGYIAIQSFLNICVVTNMVPNTGLPLPFVSYGLSSLITSFSGIGLVLNVGLQRITKKQLI